MAHYALIDKMNLVTQVITGVEESESIEGKSTEEWYAQHTGLLCKRTSYNTRAGVHTKGGTAFRKNYAGIGYTYDESRDAFIPPKPYESWKLDENTCLYDPPSQMPSDGKTYAWDEESTSWKEVT